MSYVALTMKAIRCATCDGPERTGNWYLLDGQHACEKCYKWAKTYTTKAVFRFTNGDPVLMMGERMVESGHSPSLMWIWGGRLPPNWQFNFVREDECRCTERLRPKMERVVDISLCFAEFYRTKEFEDGRVLYRQVP